MRRGRRAAAIAGVGLLSAWAAACGGGGRLADEAAAPTPVPIALAAEAGILAYGEECAAAIAEIPAFDCTQGTPARITVDGIEVPDGRYTKDMECDRPALLPAGAESDGQCVPWSRAQMWETPTYQISAFCRQKLIRPENTFLYDEIDVIAHSVTTGKTCWFSAKAPPDGDPDTGLDGRRVPPPNEATPPPGRPAAATFWLSPDSVAAENCGGCHDNDPFYYSPFVAQTGQLPADPFGKYEHIGEAFRRWEAPRSLEPRGNTCTGCHRIGATFTCGKGALESVGRVPSPGRDEWARTYPQSHWMPVGNLFTERQWDVIYGRSLDQLKSCCADPDQPECHTVPIPAG